MPISTRAAISGTVAALAAAGALVLLAKLEGRSAPQPLNATSHWLYGDDAARICGTDVQHTATGFATHHAASTLWGGLFEWLRERDKSPSFGRVVRDATITSAVAAVVDYTITPRRFTPGWELMLTKKSMALAYLAMASGFIVAEYSLPRRK